MPGDEAEPIEPGLHEVDVMLSLPIGKLTLLPTGETASGSFKAVYRLRRVDGARTKPEHVVFAVAIPSTEVDAASDQYYAVRSRLELPPGDYEMVVGLWEENTGGSSFVLHELSVGSPGRSRRHAAIEERNEISKPPAARFLRDR